MISSIIISPEDLVRDVAARARALRLAAAMTQAELADRAGVTLASLRRFERTGHASFELVVRIAMTLRVEDSFAGLFDPPPFASLDEAMAPAPARKRGRRRRTGEPA